MNPEHPDNWQAGFSSENHEWGTPAWLFDMLNRRHPFLIDAAARARTALAPEWWGPDHADERLRDSLALDWAEEAKRLHEAELAVWADAFRKAGEMLGRPVAQRVEARQLNRGPAIFVNPPYGREVGHFLERAHAAVQDWATRGYNRTTGELTVVGLVFARTDTSWWHQQVMVDHASLVEFVAGRLVFNDPKTGKPARSISCAVCGHSKGKHPDGGPCHPGKGKTCDCAVLVAKEGSLQPATAPSAVVTWSSSRKYGPRFASLIPSVEHGQVVEAEG